MLDVALTLVECSGLALRRGTVVAVDGARAHRRRGRRGAAGGRVRGADRPDRGGRRGGGERGRASTSALGSGGFDIVHVNLTRGLDGTGIEDAHVMKLNYTSLQHAVDPVEAAGARAARREAGRGLLPPRPAPVRRLGGAQARGADRLRADGGRRAAGVAFARGARAARPRPAGRPRHRRARRSAASTTRSRRSGRSTRASPSSGWDAAIAGPGPGHPRLGDGARARRD